MASQTLSALCSRLTMTPPLIRHAQESDLPALAELYDRYVRETPVTFDVEPGGVAGRRAWLAQHPAGSRYPALVAELGGSFAGYASSSRFHPKSAYQTSVEFSIYLPTDCQRLGVGRALYEKLTELVSKCDVHRVYAGVTLPNPASEAFHTALGFRTVGTYEEVGFKLGKYWSVRWFELRLAA